METWMRMLASSQECSQQIIEIRQFFFHTEMLSDQAKEFALWPWWFGSIHLSRLGWSSLTHRWGCSNRSQQALSWMHCQLAEDHNYSGSSYISITTWNGGACVVSKAVSPMTAGKIRTFLSPLAVTSVETAEQEKHFHIKLIFGCVPANIYVDFSPCIWFTHTHKQSTALILVLHSGASSQLHFIHSKWARSITQMQARDNMV